MQTNAVSQQELQESEANAKSYAAQIKAKNAEADRIKLDMITARLSPP